MAPKKRPAPRTGDKTRARLNKAADGEGALEDDCEDPEPSRKPKKQAGLKDHFVLASALAPHVKKQFDITYPADREMKALDKAKLLCEFEGFIEYTFELCLLLRFWVRFECSVYFSLQVPHFQGQAKASLPARGP